MAVTEISVGEHQVRLSSLDRVIFHEQGLTKADLVEYVLCVGDAMLAQLSGRPTTMERWPKGYSDDFALISDDNPDGEAFYQKRAPKTLPSFVDVAEITFPSGRKATAITPRNVATLVWMINLGTVRFHPWPVTAPETELVDQLRIDLDPQPGSSFVDAVDVAGELRLVLNELGLVGFPKTSGGRGVHVFVKIKPADFIDARHAVIAIGRELGRRLPDRVTTSWWKEERGERVFVDFNQMARDRLMASAYSIRPSNQARVSAPITWDELGSVSPDDFTVTSMQARFEALGDVWADYASTEPASIQPAIGWYERDAAAGEGEMPYPPEYPKMPGEPSRVQPSRAKDA